MSDPTSAAAALADPAPAAAPAVSDPAPAAAATPPAGDAPAAAEPAALKLPGKDASADDWSAFYASIGRPETPDAYELPVPEGDDGAFAKQVAPILHKAGLSTDQAKALASDWNAMVTAQQAETAKAETARVQALDAQNKAEATALANEWGTKHTENMEMARRAVRQFMPGDKAANAIEALESVLGYKGTIQFLHGVGKGLGEGDAAGLGASNTNAAPKTLAERMYPNMK